MARERYIGTKVQRKGKAIESLRDISDMFRLKCPTARKFAETLGTSPSTAWKRLEFPADMTLNEFITASINSGMEGGISLKCGNMNVEVRW